MLLEQHIAGLGTRRKAKHDIKYKRSGKYAPRKKQHDPLTLKYLVQHAWGRNNSYLSDLRKQQKRQASAACGSDGGFETLLLIAPPPLADDDEGKTLPESVMDSYELAEKKYTAAYLYAINKCREQAEKNKDSVDKAISMRRRRACAARMGRCSEHLSLVFTVNIKYMVLKLSSLYSVFRLFLG